MYDPMMIKPMRDELTAVGFQELLTAAEVDRFLADQTGTTLVVVNSVCGCAAGTARPGLRLAMNGGARPDRMGTVFAGNDAEATARVRSYFPDLPPSSPSVALFKEGKLVYFLPRHQIEVRDAPGVAAELRRAFETYCA